MLTAAMRQELSNASGPIGDIDSEPPRAQNTRLRRHLAT